MASILSRPQCVKSTAHALEIHLHSPNQSVCCNVWMQPYAVSQYNTYNNTLSAILSKVRYLRYMFLIFCLYRNYQLLKTEETGFMVRLCNVICFWKIKTHQTLVVLKAVSDVVLFLATSLHCSFHVLSVEARNCGFRASPFRQKWGPLIKKWSHNKETTTW